MKINVAKSAGFCFGVKRALNIALETAKSCGRVYMLGDIVHNEEVVKRIEQEGIRKITGLAKGKDKALLIRAHGASRKTIEEAKELGFRIIDATCPMVKEIHKIAHNMEKKGYKVIIIGDKEHDEVHGIIGQLQNKATVIESLQKIPIKTIRGIKKAAVVVQSTQNIDNVMKILRALRLYIKDLKFFNTICRPTQIKQSEIKKMPKENEVMIVIGSKNSANTKRLYEIAKSFNPKSYWISNAQEVKRSWLSGALNVGVTAGASTPDSTTKKVVARLRKINN
jgi:4-hydroxy-3-methylbut-2-enyl diphosphate reductase